MCPEVADKFLQRVWNVRLVTAELEVLADLALSVSRFLSA